MYDSECSYDLDVVMAHPFNQDTLKQAALEEGFAAARREERKMIKYETTTCWQYIKPQFHFSGI